MATYKTIHTAYGLAANAEAEATGTPIVLTHMAWGDGGGAPIEVDPAATQLEREVYRAPVNRVYQDPADPPGMFTVEGIIPGTEGGFVLREVGVIDSHAGLYALGNLPDVYKPVLEEGATADAVVRLKFAVANADVITLQIDPNVAVASQQWVLNTIDAAFLLPGGTTGQVLAKVSNTDGDVVWQDPDVASVVVDPIEEVQQLVNGQSVVDLTLTTTLGLVLYIDGLRLPPGDWTPDPVLDTRLTLNTPVSGTHELIAAQNEPQGMAGIPLQRQNNLSDVVNKAAARTNLEIYSKADVDTLLAKAAPVGMKGEFYRSTAPTGWLKCNGAQVSRTTYAALFAAIGTTYGAGNGSTTFHLPDDRGNFSRAWDDGRGIDTNRGFGTEQAAAFQAHNHAASSASAGGHSHTASAANNGSHNHTASSGAAGSHNHAGTTSAAGAHVHGFDIYEPDDAMGFKAAADAGGDQFNEFSTDAAGEHTHTFVTDTEAAHTHTVTVTSGGLHTHAITVAAVDAHVHAVTVGNTGGTETRPRNRATLWCIKY
ncbi:MAG: phage tail protein [Pseudomonadota bacterium]